MYIAKNTSLTKFSQNSFVRKWKTCTSAGNTIIVRCIPRYSTEKQNGLTNRFSDYFFHSSIYFGTRSKILIDLSILKGNNLKYCRYAISFEWNSVTTCRHFLHSLEIVQSTPATTLSLVAKVTLRYKRRYVICGGSSALWLRKWQYYSYVITGITLYPITL